MNPGTPPVSAEPGGTAGNLGYCSYRSGGCVAGWAGASRLSGFELTAGAAKGRRMSIRDLAYRIYARRREASMTPEAIPRHVGVMCDGNRRWARSAGLPDVSDGHQAGADKIFELLGWCREVGVEVVTLWLLSTDNLMRASDEIGPLLRIIEDTVQELVSERWHINPVGA